MLKHFQFHFESKRGDWAGFASESEHAGAAVKFVPFDRANFHLSFKL